MDFFSIFLQDRLAELGFSAQAAPLYAFFIALLGLVLFSWLCGILCRYLLVPAAQRLVARTETKFDDYILSENTLASVCRLVPGFLFYRLLVSGSPIQQPEMLVKAYRLVCMATEVYLAAMVLWLIEHILTNIIDFTRKEKEGRDLHLVSILQFVKIIVYCFGGIVIVALLFNRNPFNLIAGLGAAATVLMLVFRDSILGLVASIQLSANKMLKPGDWVTIKKLDINGVVESLSLTTVKVRNFDNSISTVPAYTLVSDAFQNWDGMVQSGARRVKQVLYIDVDSIGFCTEERLARLRHRRFITKAEAESGQPQVNLTLFRNYVERALRQDEHVSKDYWILARQQEHTPNGLPVELWFYFRETDFVEFEHLSAESMERFIAVLPEFGLRLFQWRNGGSKC